VLAGPIPTGFIARRRWLVVLEGNDRAIRAYRRPGFTPTGDRNPHPGVPGLFELVMVHPV
jgi:ribosomal protein S18 acetylase RimI-like enzyme